MYLKRSITVNWGNLPGGEFDYGPVNLFSGGNGSGKTTAADALQTLMTAAHDNLFNYNPGQDETTQRGRGGKQVRTLASYVLGCDDGAYARPWACDGYLAGVFHPTQGESAEPFTALIGVRARLDRAGNSAQARQEELVFAVIPGHMLSLSDLVSDGQVMPLDQLGKRLKRRFGTVELYDKKRAYLRRLYGALRGRRDAVSDREALHAARTFAAFMAYKPVRSISEFVAGEVLEKKDFGDTIRQVRQLLGTVHGMEAEARALAESVAVLARARDSGQQYVQQWLSHAGAGYGAAAQARYHNQQQYLTAKESQRSLREQLATLEQEQRLTGARLDEALAAKVQLEARRQGVAALRDKDELERVRDQLSAELSTQAAPLLAQDQQQDTNLDALANLQQLLRQHSLGAALPALESRGLRDDSRAVLALREQPRLDLQQLLGHDWVDLSPLEAGLDASLAAEQAHNRLAARLHDSGDGKASLRDQAAQLLNQSERELQRLRERIGQSEARVRRLENQRVNYPAHVQAALAAIREHCPQADPRVLCDYIEVSEPEWQMAIEGYIGGARFAILVEPEFEAEAIRIVRALAGKNRNRARVIQGDKARRDAERLSLPSGSIVEVMQFSHRTAEHFLRASYGSVLRATDAEALRGTARGITADGLGSGNYSLFRCDLDDGELVFGTAARERALIAQRSAQATLVEEGNAANDHYHAARRLLEQIERIRPLQLGSVIESMLACQRQLRAVEQQLAALDLSEHQHLEQELEQLDQRYRELRQQEGELAERHGRQGEALAQQDKLIARLAAQQDELNETVEDAEAALREAAEHCVDADAEALLTTLDQRLQNAGGDIDFADEQRRAQDSLNGLALALERAVLEHNGRARPGDSLVYDTGVEALHSADFFRRVNALLAQLDNLHNRLRNNALLEKREQLAALRDSFNTAFVSNLCHQIYQAIDDGRRALRDLNEELQHHRFGADRERFEFQWDWLPEFKEYWQFFKEVTETPNLGDGAGLFDAELSPASNAVRDKLLTMLLDGDEQQALRELERISDYRNYRSYDILKHPEGKPPIPLSQYGTGSGGQLETPAYIIRAAAVTSAFRFNEGDSHLRMVIVDEAFMHMDEARSREVIGYLTQTLGLQLIFIMPTSKCGPFMDLISNQFMFSKLPSPQPVGELNTRVLVDRQVLNRERVQELWAQHRRTIRQQAMLDFMEEVNA